MQPRHAFGVALAERLLAQRDQRGAVVESLDLDVGGIFRARGEIGRQVGDPADAGLERSFAPPGSAIWGLAQVSEISLGDRSGI